MGKEAVVVALRSLAAFAAREKLWWDRDGGGRIAADLVVYFRSFTALQAASGDGMMAFVEEVVGGTGLSGLVTQMVAEEAPMVAAATRMKEEMAVVVSCARVRV